MALFLFKKSKAQTYPVLVTDVDKLVLYSMPPFSPEAYKTWEDDGKPLDNTYIIVSDSTFDSHDPFDDRGVANSLLAFARAGEYINPESHALLIGAGVTDDDVKKLVVRGADMLADFREETIEAHTQGEKTLFDYAIFPPGDFSLTMTQKGLAQYHRIIWEKPFNDQQQHLLAQCFAAREAKRAFGDLSTALRMIIGEYKERIPGMTEIVENIKQREKATKIVSLGYISDDEISLISEALSFATRSRTWMTERMSLADFSENPEDIILSSAEFKAARRLGQIAHCWAYGVAMLISDDNEPSDYLAYANVTSIDGVLNMARTLSVAAGVDVMVKSVVEDGVPIEHVVDYELLSEYRIHPFGGDR